MKYYLILLIIRRHKTMYILAKYFEFNSFIQQFSLGQSSTDITIIDPTGLIPVNLFA